MTDYINSGWAWDDDFTDTLITAICTSGNNKGPRPSSLVPAAADSAPRSGNETHPLQQKKKRK